MHALLGLAADDVPGYRKACRRLLEESGPNPSPDTALWLAWACVLVPDAGVDPARLVQLAERAAVVAPKNRDALLVRGAALYRGGRWQEALGPLTATVAAPQGPRAPAQGVGRSSPEAFDDTGYDLLFLAMAHQRLGHAEEARRWLARGVRWMEQAPLPKTEQGGDNPLYGWNRRLAHEALRREAEALVQGTKR